MLKLSKWLILILILVQPGCVSPAKLTPTSIQTSTTLHTPTSVETPTLTQNEQIANQIDTSLATLARRDLFSGSVLVAKDGQLLLSQGYGLADIDHKIPNTPDTRFRIGSLTKQFTAMAVVILQHQGKLDVNNPICTYIERCPEAWQTITIQELLTHTSGIHNLTDLTDYPIFKKQSMTLEQIIDHFRDLPLDFKPGEKWSYSNSGYILLGSVIEKASGQAYAAFLQQNIFDPLQMKDTGYDESIPTNEDHAIGYQDATTVADYIDMSVPFSAGALYSTTEDLYKWDRALYTEEILPSVERDKVFTPFIPIPYSYLSYGYGWFIGKQFDQAWIWHTGGIDGFVSMINRFPDSHATIILLCNQQKTDVNSITTTIAPMLYDNASWINPVY